MIGYIYKLVCSDPTITEFYIGSTKSIRGRKNAHKTSCNNENDIHYNIPVYKYIRENGGFDNWIMIVIEEYEYEKKFELHSRERYYIEQLKPSLNRLIPTRTYAEWKQDNKEIISEKAKAHYKKHFERISIRNKNYAKKNAQVIKQYLKEYNIQNFEKLKEQKKAYNENNKEHLKIKKKENYMKHREKNRVAVECDCGTNTTRMGVNKHLKTKKHKRWQSLYDYIYS